MIILLCFVLPFLILLGIIIGPVFYFTNKLQKKINEKISYDNEQKRLLEEERKKQQEEFDKRLREQKERNARQELERKQKEEEALNRDYEEAKILYEKLPQDVKCAIDAVKEKYPEDKRKFIVQVVQFSESQARLEREKRYSARKKVVEEQIKSKITKETDKVLRIMKQNGISNTILDLSKIYREHDTY